jgi:hypothetical protein
MNLLYITATNLSINSGTTKKIFGQIDAMEDSGINIRYIYPSNGDIIFNDTTIASYSIPKILYYFRIRRQLYNNALQQIEKFNINSLYIRYSIFDWNFLNLIKNAKKWGCKIFLEIPTYPYDLEYKNKNGIKKIVLLIDRYYRKKIHPFVDAIFTPTEGADFKPSDFGESRIFNIPAYKFNNGINPSDITPRKKHKVIKKVLRLIAVANHAFWDGYDRVIEGIYEYYKSLNDYDLIFNIVGKGPYIDTLMQLANDFGLNDHIVFHGFKTGNALDEIYNTADLGVDAIAVHRKGLTKVPSLKAREYCLKSLPFIAVNNIDEDFNDYKYCIFVPPDDSPLDFEYIIDRFNEISKYNYIKEMRDYGERYLNWNHQFKEIIDIIKKC